MRTARSLTVSRSIGGGGGYAQHPLDVNTLVKILPCPFAGGNYDSYIVSEVGN